MTDEAPIYPVPENAEQEAALEKALATRVLQKLESGTAMFEGDGYTAFRAELEALIELRLPATSATAQNAGNLIRFLDTMKAGLAQDISNADDVVNPVVAPLSVLVPGPQD